MPPAAGLTGAPPPATASRHTNANANAHVHAHAPAHTPGLSKPNPKLMRNQAVAHDDDDDDDQETTTDDSSDEEAAFEMDGQELWTQTYCVTCDCLIEPGQGIAKASSSSSSLSSSSNPATPSSPVTHTTLKSRSGTIKARGPNASDTAPTSTAQDNKTAAASKHSPTASKQPGPAPLKRTHSAGRLHAKAGAGPLGPYKRTGSAASRLHALSELRPTTKLHDDKPKHKANTRDASGPHGRKSPAASRPSSAASNRSHSNSSGPSSFKSNEANLASNTNTTSDAQARTKKRGFLGGLGLTPAALKQQEDELAAKRKAPTPLYCSERCRLIDERRSSGLGELTQYLSQPLAPLTTATWAPPPPPLHAWTRSPSVSSIPLQITANTPESECLCPDCVDKYADASSASGAAIPSGASDTATESSSGYIYGRGAAQKPRTASGRLITPLGLHPPGASTEGYFPQYAPAYAMTAAASHNSPRVRPSEIAQGSEPARVSSVPRRSSSAASAGKASTAGTEGSGLSSESGSSLWEPRLKPRSNSGARSSNGFSVDGGATGTTSGLSTSTATPAITPRQFMMVPSSAGISRAARRLSVPGFAPTHEVDEEAHHASEAMRATSPASTLPHRPESRSHRSSLLLATSPLKLLDKASQHHAPPSIDLFSDHLGSPSARGSLLSRSLASEHTLMGASAITLTNQHAMPASSSFQERGHLDSASAQSHRHSSQERESSARRPSALSQSFSSQSFNDASASRQDQSSRMTDSTDSLSMAVGSLRLAQSRASGPLATVSRRGTDASESKPSDLRRLSLFGVAGAPARRNSNAFSISSSNSGSTSSGWLRSLSSAWLNWRSTASPAPMQADSDVFPTTDDSDEWSSHGSDHTSRRESGTSRSSSSNKIPYAQRRASSVRDVNVARSSSQQGNLLHPNASSSSQQLSDDHSAAITPTQSLVAKPTIRRGHVPAYVNEIGQGGIPGDSSSADAKAEMNADPAQRLARVRVDSFTRVTDADAAQKKVNKRRSRDISVLPPLLAPISRTGSSTNLYAQVPRSARAYSTGRAWSAANTPQMYVGSAGSPHQQQASGGGSVNGQPPHSPTLMRSPYHSSLALTQDAARAALSPSRPNSAAGYYSLQYSTGTSPRAKGLGWGAMTSIASPPTSSANDAFPHHYSNHRQSVSYGHAAAMASRACLNQAQRGQHPHHHHPHPHHPHHHYSHHHHHHHHHGHAHQHQHLHQHAHQHQHHHRHQHSWHENGQGHGHSTSMSDHHLSAAADQAGERPALGHMMTLGAPPNATGQHGASRHSTMPVTLHRSPTPSVPEDGGEMSSHDLTRDVVSRPNSALAGARRHYRPSLMPPPRSRSSMGMHAHRVQPLTSTDAVPVGEEEEPTRTWSYDHLSGLKTYPILQLPDGRETHDVYDKAWGLDDGGLAKHLGHDAKRGDGGSTDALVGKDREGTNSVQVGFQPHRKKLFYFDA